MSSGFSGSALEEALQTLELLGVALPPGNVRVDSYGDSEELSDTLLALIRSGHKRAGTGLLWLHEHENDPPAAEGDIEIVVDHRGRPVVVTRIVSVKVMPYGDVTAEYAAIEGEGDGSLGYWREAHWAYFSRECKRIGRQPSEAMPVVCTVFEVLSVLPVESAS
jgi:uncharacterized protein YhfF